MKTIEIKLYEYDELTKEAKEKALRDWNEYNDDPFMQSHMINLLSEELDEHGIKYGYPNRDLDVRYSLSHCQGDGFMFEGDLIWKGLDVSVRHSGHYCHSYSKEVDMPGASEREYADFEKVYQLICKKMEEIGYAEIAYQESEENFIETCEANEWMFEEDGRLHPESSSD